jgi:putative membrane protein
MLFFVVVLMAIAFIFGSQNHETFTLNYLIARTELSVAQAVSIFTTLGFFIGIFVTISWRLFVAMKKKR